MFLPFFYRVSRSSSAQSCQLSIISFILLALFEAVLKKVTVQAILSHFLRCSLMQY